MEWYITAIAVVALGVAAVVAAGGGGSMAKDPVRDTYEMTVPKNRFDGAAVRELRFGVVLRGYAMDQVDTVLDRVATDLEARDTRIAELEAQLGASGTTLPESSSAPLDSSSRVGEQPR
ncbi:MAG: DivIVA domain-containing protein [Janthinobacterium lividum]